MSGKQPGKETVNVLVEQVQAAELQHEQLRAKYLRQHGWRETCQTPGGYWLWTRQLPDGDNRVVLCDARLAYSMQQHISPDPEETLTRRTPQ